MSIIYNKNMVEYIPYVIQYNGYQQRTGMIQNWTDQRQQSYSNKMIGAET